MQHLYMYMSITASSCCLMFLILLFTVYYRKKKVNNTENYIYKRMLNSNLLQLIVELTLFVLTLMPQVNIKFVLIVEKLYLYCILECVLLFIYYIYTVTNVKYSKIETNQALYKKFSIIRLVLVIIMFLLPIKHHVVDGFIQYSYGAAPTFMAICSVFAIIFGFANVFINRKSLDKRKIFPLYVFVISMGLFFTIHYFNQSLFLTSLSITLISYLMFFTIENPDMKLLEELHRSKEISDSANEEKTLFLYNMTQEIRNTMHEIDDDADIILDSKDWQETYDSARNIKASTSKFTSMANDILDVSKMDAANLKVYNNKYNIKTVIKEIVSIYDNICKKKELTFRTNIDHDIPDILYGDSINLKEVLNIILNNSVKYTDKGYIELNINTIIKNDICRLIITIEDSGTGIKSDDIDKLKVDDKSLSKANKLITLMNGAMTISSNFGIGTKVKIILDQKVELNKNSEITKYDIEFKNTKILMVDDSESGIKIIEKLLKGTNIKIDTSNNGKECIDMIKAYKYDLILLDEELTQITGIELLKKIKDIRNFNTPVILLTKDNSYEYNEEYLSFGFKDYILKPIKKEDLLNKINKIVNKGAVMK